MNIRRERTHQCGLTNIDYRTKGDVQSLDRYQANLKFADMGTMNRTGYNRGPDPSLTFKEQVKNAGGWGTQRKDDPKDGNSRTFYSMNNKKMKAPVLVANRKT